MNNIPHLDKLISEDCIKYTHNDYNLKGEHLWAVTRNLRYYSNGLPYNGLAQIPSSWLLTIVDGYVKRADQRKSVNNFYINPLAKALYD